MPKFQIRYLDRDEGPGSYPPIRDLVLTDEAGVLVPGQRSLSFSTSPHDFPTVTVELYVDGVDVVLACDKPAKTEC